jgi:hypothetical protein
MITFFSIPKPHVGHIGIIQSNAIRSWNNIPGCDVILFGDEEGVAEFASEIHVKHVLQISNNEYGTPLISEAFEKALELSEMPYLAYVNSDIVLMNDILSAIKIVASSGLKDFLMVGQRHDVDIIDSLDFRGAWESRLKDDISKRGVLHGKAGIDYFIFPKRFPIRLLPFAVGRPGWDSWLIYKVRSLGIPLIDATANIFTTHQNHSPKYLTYDKESVNNALIAGGYYFMGTIRDADWCLSAKGLHRLSFFRLLLSAFLFSPLVRLFLLAKRNIYAIFRL